MPLSIRSARPEDLPTLVRLAAELAAAMGEPSDRLDAAALARDAFGADPAFDVLVAERDGALVGYAFLHPSYASEWAVRGAYLMDLYVVPQARRRGVGRALLAACAAHARGRGWSFLWWCSKPWNAAAHAFYARLGATHEPILAHALAGPAFAALAAAGEGQADVR